MRTSRAKKLESDAAKRRTQEFPERDRQDSLKAESHRKARLAAEGGADAVKSIADIPTHKSGKFAVWFDSLSAEDVKKLYNNPSYRRKIEAQLRGDGGAHEMLKVAEAPHWKKWGATTQQVQDEFAILIEKLNEGGLAKGWKHSTGVKGSKAPNSTKVHRELAAIIRKSESLDDFRMNLKPWAEKWIEGGHDALLKELRSSH